MSASDLAVPPAKQAPGEALAPRSEAELAEVLAASSDAFRVIGGGTRAIGAPVAARTLSTAALSGIVRHDPGALTLVAQAGTPVDEIEETLAAAGQRLAFEPMDHRRLLGTTGVPTIGGVVAVNASGPRRIQAGACRDSLIGVRFVDGRGRQVKNGGRVMKNVTGYDLVKLMAGSFGTLGVLSEVSFKVLPAPEAVTTLCLTGLSDGQAIAALSEALGTPYEVTAAAHLSEAPAGPSTYLRLEGLAASVAYRAQRLGAQLGRHAPVTSIEDPAASATLWRDIRDAAAFAERPGDVWRVSVRPSEAAALLAPVPELPRLYDWGGGLIWVLTPEGSDLRARLGAFAGHATLIRANDATRQALPVFHPEPEPLAALAARLRASFDPRGLLNPGLMS